LYDLKIENATIITGDGRPAFKGTVAVAGGRIRAMAPHIAGTAARRIDATGRVLCPGFIDMHTHSTAAPSMNLVRQGCTTLVGGACGFSPLDPGVVIEAYRSSPAAHNLLLFVGHNDVRLAVMGGADRAPTPEELGRMKDLVRKAMESGAIGLSAGLAYAPGCFCQTEEVIELARVAAEFGGFYDPHQRDEGLGHEASDEETLRIGREAKMPVHISHYKVAGLKCAGKSHALLARLDQARQQGQDVTWDQYPYTASCARVTLLFPKWACAGSYDDILLRLKNPEQRARIKQHLMVEEHDGKFGGQGSRVVVASGPDAAKPFEGRNVAEIARMRGRKPDAEGFAETVMELAAVGAAHTGTDRGKLVMCVYHSMSEDDVERIMKHPATMIGSDAWGIPYGQGHPHPRLYGTFPRVLGHYVRELSVLSLEDAIAKMTSAPARRLRLADRGVVRPGAWADLTIFNPHTIRDRATFEKPHQHPDGVDFVIVNGAVVVSEGQETGAAPGVFLRRP